MSNNTKHGFQLFAQHQGSRQPGGIRCLDQQNVSLAWTATPAAERLRWQKGAHDTFKTTPVSPVKKTKKDRNWLLQQRRLDFRPLDQEDADEEDEMGIPMYQVAEEQMEDMLEKKYREDRRMVEEAIMAQTGGCGEKIKRLRFLLASVQTFGNVDGVCMMAEFAMNEFNLRDGVVDRVSTLVGPWTVDNDVKRSRAVFHSNETHRIPLNISNTHLSLRELLVEILGRSEPAIAVKQGIRVGLYKGDLEDEEERLNRMFMGEKNMYHVVDDSSRRFIICLRQEYEYMMASMQNLKNETHLVYDGFPCTPDRFVLADAFVDAVAACFGGLAIPDTAKWLSALGIPLPEAFATPWERNGELFCGRHRHERNSCCATVTASRASFIILYSLEDLLKRL